MNQELSQARIDEIILFFGEYEAAKKELEQAERFGHTAIEGPDAGHNRRLESAQQRFDSAVAKIPSREAAEAACLVEIKALAGEYNRLKAAYKKALFDELESFKQRQAADCTASYAHAHPILGLDPVATERERHAAQENLNKVIYSRQVTEGQMDRAFKNGFVDPRHPDLFEVAAKRRVENLFGPHYDQQHLATVKAQFGLTDKMLNRLAIP